MKETMTRCEEKVMDIIWSSPEELNLPEIVERVNKKYEMNWKPQTVSTFLRRLCTKNILTGYRDGRTFFYQPIMSRDEYVRKITLELCDMWFGGDADRMCEVAKKT